MIATSVLVDDLDLWITGPGGTYYPWTLDPLNPSAAAVRTKANHVDNVEQVLIDVPAAGVYTLHVGGTGSLFAQPYTLLASGASVEADNAHGVAEPDGKPAVRSRRRGCGHGHVVRDVGSPGNGELGVLWHGRRG